MSRHIDDVLALIDGALDDPSTSADAARWSPEPEKAPNGFTSSDCTMAMSADGGATWGHPIPVASMLLTVAPDDHAKSAIWTAALLQSLVEYDRLTTPPSA